VGPCGKVQANLGIEQHSRLGQTQRAPGGLSQARGGRTRGHAESSGQARQGVARVRSGAVWHGRACKGGGGEGWRGMLRPAPGRARPSLGCGRPRRATPSELLRGAGGWRPVRFGDERRWLLPRWRAAAAYRSAVFTEEEEIC
jgi:hypothetical protein